MRIGVGCDQQIKPSPTAHFPLDATLSPRVKAEPLCQSVRYCVRSTVLIRDTLRNPGRHQAPGGRNMWSNSGSPNRDARLEHGRGRRRTIHHDLRHCGSRDCRDRPHRRCDCGRFRGAPILLAPPERTAPIGRQRIASYPPRNPRGESTNWPTLIWRQRNAAAF
jgi:hypothetical protein